MSDSNVQPNRHTPEPWVSERNSAYWEFGAKLDGFVSHRIGDVCATDPNHPDSGKQEANARRIVACVNGCAGINPEAVPKLVNIARLFKDVMECRRDGPWRDVPAFRLRWSIPEDETVEAFCERVVATALANAKGGEA